MPFALRSFATDKRARTSAGKRLWEFRTRYARARQAEAVVTLKICYCGLPVVSPLLPAGMTRSDDRAFGRVPRSNGSDCGTGCRSLSLGVLVLLLVLRLLLVLP